LWQNEQAKRYIPLTRCSPSLPEDVQIVLCAGAPDTEEVEREVVHEASKWPNVRLMKGNGA